MTAGGSGQPSCEAFHKGRKPPGESSRTCVETMIRRDQAHAFSSQSTRGTCVSGIAQRDLLESLAEAFAAKARLPTVEASIVACKIRSLVTDGQPLSDAFQLRQARRRRTAAVKIAGPPLHPGFIRPDRDDGPSADHDLYFRETAAFGYALPGRIEASISVAVRAPMETVQVLTVGSRGRSVACGRRACRNDGQNCNRQEVPHESIVFSPPFGTMRHPSAMPWPNQSGQNSSRCAVTSKYSSTSMVSSGLGTSSMRSKRTRVPSKRPSNRACGPEMSLVSNSNRPSPSLA